MAEVTTNTEYKDHIIQEISSYWDYRCFILDKEDNCIGEAQDIARAMNRIDYWEKEKKDAKN